MADVDIAELEKQHAELGEMIEKLGGSTKGPKSQDAEANASGKKNIKVPRVELHDNKATKKAAEDEDILKAKKKAKPVASDEEDAADGGDDEDMEKAKKKVASDEEDAADGGADDWSEEADGKKKGVKKGEDESFVHAGKTIKKSAVGEIMFGLTKSMADEIAKASSEIAKAKDEALTARMEKRADEQFSHVPGSTTQRAAMLKALEKMDEPLRKSFEAVLNASEKLAKTAFGKIGHNGGELDPESNIEKTKLDFEGKVNEIKKRDKITKDAAMSKARTEHPQLFKAYQDALSTN